MSFSDITGKAKEVWDENVKGTLDSAVETVKDTTSDMFGDDDEFNDLDSAPVVVTQVDPESVEVIYHGSDTDQESTENVIPFLRNLIDHGSDNVNELAVAMYAGIIYDLDDVYLEVDSSAELTHAFSLSDIVSQLDESPGELELVPGEVFDWDNASVFILAEYKL